MKPFIAALITLSLAAGCRYGPKIENLNLASSPRGAAVQVTRTTGGVSGELLAVNEDGLVVLEGRRMVTVPFSEIRDARFAEVGSAYRIGGGKRPDSEAMARLRRVSHFPQGITPEIKASLLTIYQQ
ncbi:MAG: hypothetical protein M3P26_08235 [Gemmatimonadota bacterium]|nr:hypothetical protein [Gemmatimonadota bacterium]